jgi:hypothetical protein
MKRIGLSLIVLAFLAGAWYAVLDPVTLPWTPFLVVLGFGFVGAGLVWWAKRSHHGSEEVVRRNTAQLHTSLDAIVAEVEGLTADAGQMDVYEVHRAIDRRVLDHLNDFVSFRDTMKVAYGLPGFAAVMGPYAGGERYLNRVWSASADGYIDEVNAYLTKAHEQFEIALGRMTDLRESVGG